MHSRTQLSTVPLRLPTGPEWVHACAAGTQTTYFIGNTVTAMQSYANVSNGEQQKPMIGGQFFCNPWGLHDMYGNVPELIWPDRALGGSYLLPAEACNLSLSNEAMPVFGFRIVRSAE
ncbi:MAG: SUMF1/EgtB/PvdO family nonheme iron enzyme [Planctomycetota bacterium]